MPSATLTWARAATGLIPGKAGISRFAGQLPSGAVWAPVVHSCPAGGVPGARSALLLFLPAAD